MPHRVIRTIDGHRGVFLILAGLIFLPVSISFIFVESPGRDAAVSWLPEAIQLWHFGIFFTAASLAGIMIGALSRRLPARIIPWGFVAVLVAPMGATVLFLTTAILGLSDQAWLSVSAYGTLVAIIYHVSSWPNPPSDAVLPPPLRDRWRKGWRRMQARLGRRG